MTPGEQAKKAKELGISLADYRKRMQSLDEQLSQIMETSDEEGETQEGDD